MVILALIKFTLSGGVFFVKVNMQNADIGSLRSRAPIERFHAIIAILVQGKCNATKLATKLEISHKTIHRDLEFMRERLNIPIETTHEGCHLTAPLHVCAVCAGLAAGEVKPVEETYARPLSETRGSSASTAQAARAALGIKPGQCVTFNFA